MPTAAQTKIGRLPVSTNPAFVPLDDTPSQKVQAMLSKMDAMIAALNMENYILRRGNTTAPTFNATEQLVIMDNATGAVDTAGWWDATNHRYTPQVAGYYRAIFQITFTTIPNSGVFTVSVRKNGTDTATDSLTVSATPQMTTMTLWVEDVILLNGTSDYIDFALSATAGAAISTGTALTFCSVEGMTPPTALTVVALNE